jgi:DNA-binding transcriptional regulator YdaS (Cro superfamily)
MTPNLSKAFERINKRQLAIRLRISAQAVSQWRRVPVSRVLEVEKITGVPREELRPDVYPPREAAR